MQLPQLSHADIAAVQKKDPEILDIQKNGYCDHVIKNVSFEI